MKKKKSLEQINKELRKRIAVLERENLEMYHDRNKFRDYFVNKFKWFVELNGTEKTPNMTWLVQDMGRFLNKVNDWYW